MAYISAAGKTPEEDLTDVASEDEEPSASTEAPSGDQESPTKPEEGLLIPQAMTLENIRDSCITQSAKEKVWGSVIRLPIMS